MWYAFEASNTETRYGWTSNESVADAVVAKLNEGREVNLFSASQIDDDEAASMGLLDRNDLICTDDSRPEDFE